MSGRRRTLAPRDQAASAFSNALLRLCEATGAVAAALVDGEGETVDYAGGLDPFDIKVVAAELRLVLSRLTQSQVPCWSETHEMFVRAGSRSFALIRLDAGYAIVLQLARHRAELVTRGLGEAVQDISREAGLPIPKRFARAERWKRVAVRATPDDRTRPASVWHQGGWREVTILGLYRDPEFRRRDQGYRARLANGAEIFLVREPLGRWYADSTFG
jgi:hypothetical protein